MDSRNDLVFLFFSHPFSLEQDSSPPPNAGKSVPKLPSSRLVGNSITDHDRPKAQLPSSQHLRHTFNGQELLLDVQSAWDIRP